MYKKYLFLFMLILGQRTFSVTYNISPYDTIFPPVGEEKIPSEGTIRAIIVIASCSEHQGVWEARPDYVSRVWPQMPLWMVDSLLAPDETSIVTDQYKWSISNFQYWESFCENTHKHILIGDVNPGKNGEFFCDTVSINNPNFYSIFGQEIYQALGNQTWRQADYDCIIMVFPYGGCWAIALGESARVLCDPVTHWNDLHSTLTHILTHEYSHLMGVPINMKQEYGEVIGIHIHFVQ